MRLIDAITVWEGVGTAADLSAEAVLHHHQQGDLLRGDYLLVSTSAAIALYEMRQLDVRLVEWLNEDVRREVVEHMRERVEAARRVAG